MTNYTELEAEVAADLERDKVYPWNEPDMRRWAVAFRLIRQRRGLGPPDDGDMFIWFVNVCAMGEAMAAGGPLLNADGMQSVRDGELPDPSFYFKRWRRETA